MAIESSCDETACSIVENGVKELASTLATSAQFHYETGGIVPEVAARKQTEYILPVIESTIKKFAEYYNVAPSEVKNKIDAIAVTVGPGLVGSLIVGVEAAKALALAWNKPLIPVNHLLGHVYANFIGSENLDIFPAVVLIVSGGHTDLILMSDHGVIKYLGGTIDDAAGEAFDKAARLLSLGDYLGGPKLSKAALEYTGEPISEKLPRALLHDQNFDFSFSGLKTAVKRLTDKKLYTASAIAKEFEESVVEVLVEKTLRAVKETGAKSVLMGGGVSANQKLRKELTSVVESKLVNVNVYIPPVELCTDNAVSIGSAAFFNQKYTQFDQIVPNSSITVKD